MSEDKKKESGMTIKEIMQRMYRCSRHERRQFLKIFPRKDRAMLKDAFNRYRNSQVSDEKVVYEPKEDE